MKIVKRIDGKVAAEMTLTKLVGNEWEIAYLSVAIPFRGRGLASELLEQAKAYALQRGLVLIGFVDPVGGATGLDAAQVKAWLKRRGFKHGRYDFNEAVKRNFFQGSTNNKRVMIFNEL